MEFNKHIFSIIFLIYFGCSGIKEEIQVSKVIPPDNFIQEQSDKIKKTLALGPGQAKDGMNIKRERKIIFTEDNKILEKKNKPIFRSIYFLKNFINSYKFPYTNKMNLEKIKPEQELKLLQKRGNWFQFLIHKNSSEPLNTAYIKPVYGNIRSKPTMKSDVLNIACQYQIVEILEQNHNWYKVGFKIKIPKEKPFKLKLNNSLNYYDGSFKNSKKLGVFKAGQKITVQEERNKFLLVSSQKNIGWIKIPKNIAPIFISNNLEGWAHKNILIKLPIKRNYSTAWVDYSKFSTDLTLEVPEEKISVNFDNVSIRDAFKTFGELAGRNILVGEDVKGTISAKLEDVNFNAAFDSLMKLKSLGQITEGNITSIHKIGFIKNYERSKNERISELTKLNKIKNGLEPLITEIFTIYYANAKDIKKQIDDVFGASGEGVPNSAPEISVDERTNTLIAKGYKSQLDLASEIIKNIDIKTDQILIEAFILEVNDDFEEKLGTRFGASGNSGDFSGSGLATGTGANNSGTGENSLALGSASGSVSNLLIQNAFGGIGLLLNPGRVSLKLELNALEKEGVTNILSNPRIFTLDNEEALISQGVSVPRPGSAFGGGTITEFEPAELKLAVTPNVVGDGNIILDVEVDKDTPDFTRNPTSPPINTKKIKTKLLVKNNSIVVIGGIYSQTQSDSLEKVPGINKAPIIGNAFKNSQNLTERRELLIFISPHIV